MRNCWRKLDLPIIEVIHISEGNDINPINFAIAYSGLNRNDEAIDKLD